MSSPRVPSIKIKLPKSIRKALKRKTSSLTHSTPTNMRSPPPKMASVESESDSDTTLPESLQEQIRSALDLNLSKKERKKKKKALHKNQVAHSHSLKVVQAPTRIAVRNHKTWVRLFRLCK